MTPAMLFEVITIGLLASIGTLMGTAGQPGWGLIISAVILALISIFLRSLRISQPAMATTSSRDTE